MKARMLNSDKSKGTVYYCITTIVDGYADDPLVELFSDDNNRIMLFKTREEALANLETAAVEALDGTKMVLVNPKLNTKAGVLLADGVGNKSSWLGKVPVQAYICEAITKED